MKTVDINESFNTLAYYAKMREEGVVMAYNGPISQSILLDLGSNLKNKFGQDSTIFTRRIFSIFIELAQNILHHSEERLFSMSENKEIGMGMLLVRKVGNYYVLSSANLAKQEAAERIKNKCDYINSLNKDELKQFYKEQRQKPHEEGKSGGNIGLLDMARKSGNPLGVDLKVVDNGFAFMVLKVTLAI